MVRFLNKISIAGLAVALLLPATLPVLSQAQTGTTTEAKTTKKSKKSMKKKGTVDSMAPGAAATPDPINPAASPEPPTPTTQGPPPPPTTPSTNTPVPAK